MSNQITYNDKVDLNIATEIANINKVTAADMNEIKQVVNAIDNETSANINDIIQAINNPTYTTTEGTDLSIDNTRVGKMKFEYYGDTEQETTTGKNLLNESTLRQGSGADTTATNRAYIPANYYLETGTYTIYTNLNLSSFKYAVGVAANAFPNPSSYIYDSRLANNRPFHFYN
jgi:hypothetical protein